jgi:hypothetical protein
MNNPGHFLDALLAKFLPVKTSSPGFGALLNVLLGKVVSLSAPASAAAPVTNNHVANSPATPTPAAAPASDPLNSLISLFLNQ